MLNIKPIIALCCAGILLSGCSVMSTNMRDQVDSVESFQDLAGDIGKAKGSTVILGGYVIEVANDAEHSTITLLQAPLGFRDEPGSRDKSRGRLIVEYPGFLDPEVYTKDRKITIGGRIVQGAAAAGDNVPYPFLRLAAAEIYLWPLRQKYYHDDYWWGYPHHPYYWSRWRHPHYRYGAW